jgi:hypothetical protein
MVLDGGRVGTYGFSFGREGLKINDQGVPLPAADGLKALNDALAPSGFSVRFAEPVTLTGGATATVFEIVNTNEVPSAGRGTLFVRFGGATSAVAPGAGGGLPALPEVTGPVDAPAGPAEHPPAGPAEPTTPPGATGESSLGVPPTARGPGAVGPRGRRASASGTGIVAPPALSLPATADEAAGVAAPAGAAPTGRPAVGRTQLLASPREFQAPQVVSAVLLTGGLLALGSLVVWRATRKVAQWTA